MSVSFSSVPPDPPPADAPPTVAELLRLSRHHAQQRKRHTGMQKNGAITSKPDYTQATLEAQQALDLRLQAHQLDPEHQDPAWLADPVPHAQMVSFLEKYITTP
jgi:hypothetical protein